MFKNKQRAQRRANTFNYIKKQQKIAKLHSFNNDAFIKESGRYKKQAHMDCGRPKCGICGNPRKNKIRQKSKTIQEIKADESFSFSIKNMI